MMRMPHAAFRVSGSQLSPDTLEPITKHMALFHTYKTMLSLDKLDHSLFSHEFEEVRNLNKWEQRGPDWGSVVDETCEKYIKLLIIPSVILGWFWREGFLELNFEKLQW